MKAVIQRVLNASVAVDGKVKGGIKSGLLAYVGVALDDTESDAIWLSQKTAHLRVFDDADGVMNLSLKDICARGGDAGVLAISQFTLLGDARKGRRPSWHGAAAPEKAKGLYEFFAAEIRRHGLACETGEFQAHMMVSYTNDGPVTLLLDSKETK